MAPDVFVWGCFAFKSNINASTRIAGLVSPALNGAAGLHTYAEKYLPSPVSTVTNTSSFVATSLSSFPRA